MLSDVPRGVEEVAVDVHLTDDTGMPRCARVLAPARACEEVHRVRGDERALDQPVHIDSCSGQGEDDGGRRDDAEPRHRHRVRAARRTNACGARGTAYEREVRAGRELDRDAAIEYALRGRW
jgi:hypothetical protein